MKEFAQEDSSIHSFVENRGTACQFSILITVGCPPACGHHGPLLRWTCQRVTSCPAAAWPYPTYSRGAAEGLPAGRGVHRGAPFSSSTAWIPLLLSCQTVSAFRLQPAISYPIISPSFGLLLKESLLVCGDPYSCIIPAPKQRQVS